MGLQIKGVNTKLLLYKTSMERKIPFSERMVEKSWDIRDRLSDLSCYEVEEVQDTRLEHAKLAAQSCFAKAKETALAIEWTGVATAALVADEVERRKRKKALMSALECKEEDIAIDINEFIDKKHKQLPVKYYGESIRYSAQIQPRWLSTLDTIWGDAHFEALDSCENLSALKSVWGDLWFSQVQDQTVDLNGLHVQMVYGDIHAERALTTNGLEELLVVGGKIHFQDGIYTLDEFQEMVRSNQSKQKQL